MQVAFLQAEINIKIQRANSFMHKNNKHGNKHDSKIMK